MVDGERMTFDVFGLYNGVFAMSDRQTGSVWSHLDGASIRGPLAGKSLEPLPLIHTTWAEWRTLHPNTTVLDPDTPFRNRYRPVVLGRAGLGPEFVRSLLSWDSRLSESAIVVGVVSGSQSRAYVLDALPQGLGVINDSLLGQPLVVFYNGDTPFGIAFSRVLAGVVLRFSVDAGIITDRETGTVWSVDGAGLRGPLRGQRLAFVTSFITEWYGWAAFHPGTDVYQLEIAQVAVGQGDPAP